MGTKKAKQGCWLQGCWLSGLLLGAVFLGCGGGGSIELSAAELDRSIPGFERWEANMLNFGRQLCNPAQIKELSTWEGNIWYYDGIRIYYQIADYTQDKSWEDCAGYVRDVYRAYVLESGTVPGWRVFPHGLQFDYERRQDPASRQALKALAFNSAYAHQGGGADFTLSRETAYLIHAYLSAAAVGEAEHPRLKQAVDFALGHLEQWSGTETAAYIQPFMAALSSEALIRYYELRGDSRIPPALKRTADWLWRQTWDAATNSFLYIKCRPGATAGDNDCQADSKGAPDLNLLIAPLYGWLYQHTGEAVYRERGDQIFLGGVNSAYLGGGKQFSQNYRWSFDYLRWRGRVP